MTMINCKHGKKRRTGISGGGDSSEPQDSSAGRGAPQLPPQQQQGQAAPIPVLLLRLTICLPSCLIRIYTNMIYWDLRQPNPAHVQALLEHCYALTVRHPLMVVATADRNLIVYNLQNPQTEFKRISSPLKYQTRCVAASPDQQGFLVGSIEGRVGVHHLDESQKIKNFTFKCHREGNDIYSVNALNFHPVHHTFATAGSVGTFNFWDKDSKQRLKVGKRLRHLTKHPRKKIQELASILLGLWKNIIVEQAITDKKNGKIP